MWKTGNAKFWRGNLLRMATLSKRWEDNVEMGYKET
jgi:hypothetical protein